jgi:hypothetical protein
MDKLNDLAKEIINKVKIAADDGSNIGGLTNQCNPAL